MDLIGAARRPNIDFSVTNHDFGPCFVGRSGVTSAVDPFSPSHGNTPFEQLDVVLSNKDLTDCWVSTTFQRSSWLDVQLVTSMIEAGGSLVVPIIFTPREYKERGAVFYLPCPSPSASSALSVVA